MRRTRQTLGIAPHEAVFKKNTKSSLRHYKELLTVTQISSSTSFCMIAIPTPLSLHASSKIIANFPSSSTASNYPALWVPLTLSISSSLSSCHLAHFRRNCFASSTSCPLHSFYFSLLYLPFSIFRFQCAAVLSLLLA